MSWPADSQFAPEPPRPGQFRARLAGLAGVTLLVGGALAVGAAALLQQHAPSPSDAAAGHTGPGIGRGPSVRRSLPVSVTIPAIGVRSTLLRLGRNADGSMAVPPIATSADEAAWYEYSVTPGQRGAAVIEGHVDSHSGPAVFFRLGALRPGNTIDVMLADGVTAVFEVTGVREYAKDEFPAREVYGTADFAALRLITCGGGFDPATGHYLSSVVVFAALRNSHQATT